jgi:hypothetical protein
MQRDVALSCQPSALSPKVLLLASDCVKDNQKLAHQISEVKRMLTGLLQKLKTER